MNDAFERMDEEFPYEKGSLAYQWEWVKRKLRVEMNLSEASFHCQVLGEIMRQKRYSDRVDDSPPLHLEEIFIFRPSSHNPLPKNVHKARAIRIGRRLRDLDSKYDIFTENGEYVFVKLTEWASQKEECGSSAVEKSLKHPDVDLWPHGKSGEKAGRRLLRLMKDLIDFADQHDGKED